MKRGRPRSRKRREWLAHAARVLWVLLSAIHVPILVGAVIRIAAHGPSASTVAGALLLLASTAFFVLKAIDLPALRWGCRRRGALAFLVVCALVHQDVRAAIQGHVVLAATVTTVASAVDWSRVRRRLLERVLDWVRAAAAPRIVPALVAAHRPDDVQSPRLGIFIRGRASPRGPPA